MASKANSAKILLKWTCETILYDFFLQAHITFFAIIFFNRHLELIYSLEQEAFILWAVILYILVSSLLKSEY